MPLSDSFFGNLGGAVSGVFGAIGQAQSAKGYKQAAEFASENATIAGESAKIQQLQAGRQIYKNLSTANADIAANGLAGGGSAGDILRDSAQQGALTKQLITQQGAINVLGYQAEAASYSSMASAAKSSSFGDLLGAGLKLAAAFI